MLVALERDGFVLLRSIVDGSLLDDLLTAIESMRESKSSPGIRNLLTRCSEVKKFAHSEPALNIAQSILGIHAKPVRVIFFDKTPASNWYVTWHQDVSIAVKEQIDVEGYGPWSVKDGVVHVQPPARTLEHIASLRIHLDACSVENGAIKFIPGSHAFGILEQTELARQRDNSESVPCPAERGDIVIMRPLILHSSSISKNPEHRRVLHIEYAGIDLPRGLEWAEA